MTAVAGQPVPAARLGLIGSFTAARDDHPVAGPELGSRKARLLLELLAVERGRTVPLAQITEVLWDRARPAGPAENVATLVSRLRRSLGAGIIQGGRAGYRLGQAPAVQVDLDDASRWAAEAERRLAAAEPALAVAAATRAHQLLSAGLVLEDEPGAGWAQPARDEQAELTRRAKRVLAEAALAAGDPSAAVAAAASAVADDPYDERAQRVLMRAHAAAGQPARALVSYAALRDVLATELGADPAPETRELHLAVLREQELPPSPRQAVAPGRPRPVLPGRDGELSRLRAAWNGAAAGRPSLVLVCGEAGIGKTRLAEELADIAVSTGGTVLAARCYETERSLFLQPFTDAITAAARTIPPAIMTGLAGGHAAVLSRLVPELAVLLGPQPSALPVAADIERRRTFEAVTAFVLAMAERSPVLLSLDDLQNAGRATVELLHYLTRHARGGRLLAVATVRAEEGAGILDALASASDRVDLGELPAAAVADLAAAAGLADQAESINRRTRGHALFVVETLRALTAGNTGIPDSLEAAVLARVRRAGPAVESALRAAAVLGTSFNPALLAGLLGENPQAVVATCADAHGARLLVVAERDYEFANDLIREVLYATTPVPTRLAHHGHAADLLVRRPEAMAAHAAAAADWARAARGWLLAGEEALARFGAADAIELLTRSVAAAGQAGDQEVRARALLARGWAKETQACYADAVGDIEAAIASARETGDRRMEMSGLIAQAGDAPVALGRPLPDAIATVRRGLSIATELSDRAAEATLRGRLAIYAVNGLRFTDAAEQSRLAVRAARASGDDEALAAALDGAKAAVAYLGDTRALMPVIEELEPLLRRLGDLRRLHWTMFESAFPALAAGDWAAATARIGESLTVGRRTGSLSHAAWHIAVVGVIARLQGRYADALRIGREAVAVSEEAPHAWTAAVAGAELGCTLLELGSRHEAITVLERTLLQRAHNGAQASQLRCLAPLAEATGSPAVLAQAADLLSGISAPSGMAWVTADGCYLAVARAWLNRGEPEQARAVLAPLLAAAAQLRWVAPLADASLVDGQAAMAAGRPDEAMALLDRAVDLGRRHGLPRIAREAAAARTLTFA